MGALVVQVAAAVALERLPVPASAKAVASDSHLHDAAQYTRIDNLLYLQEICMITIVLVDGQKHPGLFGDSDHLVYTFQSRGHRFLDNDMLARSQRRRNVAHMQLAGRCNDEQLNRIVSDDLVYGRVGPGSRTGRSPPPGGRGRDHIRPRL